jgi:hypothetical protein
MKINHFLVGICLASICFISPGYVQERQGNTAVKISETGNIYQFKARYDQTKTRRIQEYMSESLKETGFKFTNTQLDANLTLNGGINFYIRSYAGELALKFDKRKNNTDDYTKFKKMCEGIKTIVQEN